MSTDYEPVDDVAAARRECQHLTLEREGIPVVLALEDLRDRRPVAREQHVRADGAGLARLLRIYARQLPPGSDDDDLTALYTVLSVIGHRHVRERA